jgi:hypothetical protein
VKYKRDPGSGHSSDLYQLLAYATASRLPDATLVYADGPPSPTTIQVCGSETAIHLHHLDLAAAPDQLLGQIQALAATIRPGQALSQPLKLRTGLSFPPGERRRADSGLCDAPGSVRADVLACDLGPARRHAV